MGLKLEQLQPVEVLWEDTAWLARWHSIEEAMTLTPADIVTRGYFLFADGDCFVFCQHYGKVSGQLHCASITSIPMKNIKSISPRRESLKEKLVRWKGV